MKNKLITLCIGILFIPALSFSTHIVGGELNYKCLGGNLYEIKLRVYRDCYNGVPPFDMPAYVGVFDSNNVLLQKITMVFPGSTVISPTQANPCIIPPTNICVEVAEYVEMVSLPPRPGGYQLAYQRCCRNPTVTNMVNPANQGTTYYAMIPDQSIVCNSNPVFKNWPPLFVCVNAPMVFDHSAIDIDGDSIVYEMCTPLTGGTSSAPQPNPPSNPPYPFITWKAPYSTADVLGGTPMTINSTTGLLKATPNTTGQFVVGVCANEYRNGVLLSSTKRDFQFNVVACPAQQNCDVWPGDTDNNYAVNNYDLLPIGLYYGKTGTGRASISNTWQGYPEPTSWGYIQNNGYDIKHADCNGDSIINNDDTLAVNLNFSLTHLIISPDATNRITNPDLYFVTSSSTYLPGAWVNVDVMAGTAAIPVDDLYGIGFNIEYDALLVQPGTESLTYSPGWLGTRGTDAITISTMDALTNTAYGAITRIDQTNKDGYGKIASFRFQTKSEISSDTVMNFSFSGYIANDAIGDGRLFNLQGHSINISPLATAVNEKENVNDISIYPNPYSGNTTISYILNKKSSVNVEVYNAIGQKLETLVKADQSVGNYKYTFSAQEKAHDAGIYFVKITVNGKTTMRKIVEKE
ncbi:MAG: T9SS type A sorting domain-containing protein [Bacteroidota bacterium]